MLGLPAYFEQDICLCKNTLLVYDKYHILASSSVVGQSHVQVVRSLCTRHIEYSGEQEQVDVKVLKTDPVRYMQTMQTPWPQMTNILLVKC